MRVKGCHAVVLCVGQFAAGLAGVRIDDVVGAGTDLADRLEFGEGGAVEPTPSAMEFFEDDGHVVTFHGVVGSDGGQAVFPESDALANRLKGNLHDSTQRY